MSEQEDIVDLKIEKPRYTRIEAGRKMYIPFGHYKKESYLSILVFNANAAHFNYFLLLCRFAML